MNQIDLVAKTIDIAQYLNGWRYNALKSNKQKHHVPCVTLSSADAEFTIMQDWQDKTKLKISGNYPQQTSGNRPSIGVSFSRNGKAIANDITRRFLPEFTVELLKRNNWVKSKEASSQQEQIKFSALQRILPDLKVTNNNGYPVKWHSSKTCTGVEFVYDHWKTGKDTELSARLTFDNAIKVAAFIKSL